MLSIAAVTGLIVAIVLNLLLPRPSPGRGSLLHSVSTDQLSAAGLHLEPAVQPLDLPPWMTSAGIRFPISIVPREQVRSEIAAEPGVINVTEIVLAYATVVRWEVSAIPLDHRLTWVVVATQARPGHRVLLLTQVWLVDASTGAKLARLSAPLAGGMSLSPAPTWG
jgi:hypothetical protein